MTVFDIGENEGVWFDMEGGGKVQLRTMTADSLKAIRKQTVKRKVDYKRVDGKPERFEYDEVNEDLQNELFWDYVIAGWENLYDGKGAEIPCNRENKNALMSRSAKFARFVNECLKTLADDEMVSAEQAEKN